MHGVGMIWESPAARRQPCHAFASLLKRVGCNLGRQGWSHRLLDGKVTIRRHDMRTATLQGGLPARKEYVHKLRHLAQPGAHQACDVSLRHNDTAVIEASALPVGFAAAALKVVAPQIAEGLADVALQPF